MSLGTKQPCDDHTWPHTPTGRRKREGEGKVAFFSPFFNTSVVFPVVELKLPASLFELVTVKQTEPSKVMS